jgi:hypothetical protein
LGGRARKAGTRWRLEVMPRVAGKKGLCGENKIDASVQDFGRRRMVFVTNISVLEKKIECS